MTLQHKGGVTKSFCANCIAQVYGEAGRVVEIIDADPSNKSLLAYKGLRVAALDIMNENDTINSRKFDDLIEDIVAADRDFVIDNGATNFLSFMSYLADNHVSDVLADNGCQLVIHVPIVGGEAMLETLKGLHDIAGNIGERAKIVLWLNEAVKGPIRPGGKDFEDTQVYQTHAAKIGAIIRVPYHASELFAKDMDELLTRKLTFAEAIAGPDFRLMAKQRLRQLQREIFDQVRDVI